MTTGCRPRRLNRRHPRKQPVRISARGGEPAPGRGRLHGQVSLGTIFGAVLTGQRISDLKKVDGNGDSHQTPKAQEETQPPKARAGLSRRRALTVFGLGAGALIAEQALVADGIPPAAGPQVQVRSAPPEPSGYAPNGTAGRAAALPLDAVQLLDSPFRLNQARNTTYLLFLDPERMLRSFRLNYGEPTTAEPLGGWEKPDSQIRGHMTGHLLSALALTYANTGDADAKSRGQYLVSQLAAFQAKDASRGFHAGYLSAFPEGYFDILEQGKTIWAPYYMIHKYLAGMIDQYQLAGDDQALDVAKKLADWVDWRTHRLSYGQMQMILQTEFGGLAEALANLYTITGQERYLAAAQRFYHAIVLDPLAEGMDNLPGLQANVTTPKIIACLRMWEETGSSRYRDIARNFWDIVTGHHVYVIGGAGNYEHFQQPDTVAAQLSNFTCENCVSYNMLKLTRLLHFHQPGRTDLLDYYERTLLNLRAGTRREIVLPVDAVVAALLRRPDVRLLGFRRDVNDVTTPRSDAAASPSSPAGP